MSKVTKAMMFRVWVAIAMASIPCVTWAEHPDGYHLIDGVCAIVGDQTPVLRSEVVAKSTQDGISFDEGLDKLIRDKALIIYATKQLKYNLPEIRKSAKAHIEGLREKNKLSLAQFAEILRGSPYFKSIDQFEEETFFAMLQNQIRASLMNQIVLEPQAIEEEYNRVKDQKKDGFDVVFISFSKDIETGSISGKNNITNQISEAKKIKKQIGSNIVVDSIKKDYENRGVSVIGPIAYQEGDFNANVEKVLKDLGLGKVSDPFLSDGVVTMVMKIKTQINDDFQKTGLEEAKSNLYNREVTALINRITGANWADLPVLNNCNIKKTGSSK